MPYNPMKDEKTEYTLAEFVSVAKEELDNYEKEWSPPNATNDHHTGKHTWDEWFGTFLRYMSW